MNKEDLIQTIFEIHPDFCPEKYIFLMDRPSTQPIAPDWDIDKLKELDLVQLQDLASILNVKARPLSYLKELLLECNDKKKILKLQEEILQKESELELMNLMKGVISEEIDKELVRDLKNRVV